MLEKEVDERTDVSQPWEEDNQAWWDWYVSLADNTFNATEVEPAPSLPETQIPCDADVFAELARPFPVTEQQRIDFRTNGFIKLRQVFSPGIILRLRAELVRLLQAEFEVDPDTGANDRFLSLEMTWLDNPLVRAYVLSPRLAQISADLLGVNAVRLYHDNVLAKQPGCGRTPWHFDDHHFPLDTNNVVTAWMPAQAISHAMGPLAFAYPLDVHRLVDAVTFEKSGVGYDRGVADVFAKNHVAVDDTPFDVGDVSFHHNLSFHTAASNHSDRSRIVLANTYYEDGARIIDSPTMVSGDWQKFLPGVKPAEVAASPLNPVCWPVETDT